MENQLFPAAGGQGEEMAAVGEDQSAAGQEGVGQNAFFHCLRFPTAGGQAHQLPAAGDEAGEFFAPALVFLQGALDVDEVPLNQQLLRGFLLGFGVPAGA